MLGAGVMGASGKGAVSAGIATNWFEEVVRCVWVGSLGRLLPFHTGAAEIPITEAGEELVADNGDHGGETDVDLVAAIL